MQTHLLGDQVRLLRGEVEALSTRLDLINEARQSIDLAYYHIRDDDTVGQILAALIRAAERGVRIRVIVDAHPNLNSPPKSLMAYLIERGIQIRERPVDARYKLEIGRPRLHDRLSIVDGTRFVTGGRKLVKYMAATWRKPSGLIKPIYFVTKLANTDPQKNSADFDVCDWLRL